MATVTFRGVSKQFSDGTEALKDFDLHVADGELMVLVGPSGCGKSTVLRLLAGLETVTSGEILIDDNVVNAIMPQERNVAMVFQNYALYPHMNVRRNLAFPLRMMKLSTDEINRRTEWAAELLQLTDLLDRMPKQLSGGQRQRVAMGRAIVREPQVFLMDEPLSNLDAKLRVQIRTEIADLQKRLKVTTVYVTHDQVEAMTLGDRIAVMHAGQLQQVDEPQVVYEQPANIFVAQFIGSPGMNIFASRLLQSDSDLMYEFSGKQFTVPDDGRVSFATLSAYRDQPVFIGLRPEAVELANTDDAHLTFTITAVEVLGHERLFYLNKNQNNGENMSVRLQYDPGFTLGDSMPLCIRKQELYFFDQKGNKIS